MFNQITQNIIATQRQEFRCVRSTNNETRVERNRSTSIPMELSKSVKKNI
jgi:hypothetical protein